MLIKLKAQKPRPTLISFLSIVSDFITSYRLTSFIETSPYSDNLQGRNLSLRNNGATRSTGNLMQTFPGHVCRQIRVDLIRL